VATSKRLDKAPFADFVWEDTAPTATYTALTGAVNGGTVALVQVDIDNTADASDVYLKMMVQQIASGAPVLGTAQEHMIFKAPAGKRIIYTIPEGILMAWLEPSISSQLYYAVSTGHTHAEITATSGTAATVKLTFTD
jgi:hypothetical protein